MWLWLLFLLPLEASMAACNEGMLKTQARQEIEYLRRWYAKATDKIGIGSEAAIAEGRDIYRRIFTTDVEFHASPEIGIQSGPDAWVEVVKSVLVPLGPTQHLVGTQVVDIEQLVIDDDCQISSGSARMESYVQAWHEQKDEKVWIYLGIYHDLARYSPDHGWQIYRMEMEQIGGETRFMDSAVGKARE